MSSRVAHMALTPFTSGRSGPGLQPDTRRVSIPPVSIWLHPGHGWQHPYLAFWPPLWPVPWSGPIPLMNWPVRGYCFRPNAALSPTRSAPLSLDTCSSSPRPGARQTNGFGSGEPHPTPPDPLAPGCGPGGRGFESRRSPSRSSRTVDPDGEDRTMAQTDQAWDWRVELRDEEHSELERLRGTVAQLRTELDQAHEFLRSCRQHQQDARQALRQLDEARLWRRRRVRKALRERQLL